MLYTLNDRHIEFKNKIKKWSEENIASNQNILLSKELLENLKSLKILGFHSPKPFAGRAKNFLFHCIAITEIAKVNPNISLSIITNYLFESTLIKFGNKEQIIKYVNSVDRGDSIASVAILDKKNDYDIKNISTKAKLEDKNYILNGEKFCHSNIENSNFILIFAKLDNSSDDISAFIIEKDYDGVEIISNSDNLLYSQGIIKLNNVKVPKENLLGIENDGASIIKSILISAHLSISSHYLGLSIKIYQELLNIVKEEIQNIDEKFLNAFSKFSAEIESCKIHIYSTAEKKNNGLESLKESAYSKLLAYNIANNFITTDFLKGKIDEKYINKIIDFNLSNIYSSDIENTNELLYKLLANDNKKDINYPSKIEEHKIKRKKIIFNSSNMDKNIDDLINVIKPFVNKDNKSNIYDDIENANIAVGVGLGIGDRENIYMAEKFAEKIGGVIACTYSISKELHWLPSDRIISTFIKIFSGDIYFAFGLSGNKEHLSGIKGAKNIIAINTDKHAKIFSECDYGIVGDINEILPILINKLNF